MFWDFGSAVSSQQQAAGDHVQRAASREPQQQKHPQHSRQRQQAGQELVRWTPTNLDGVMNRLVDNHYAMDPMSRSFDRYDGALKSTAGSSDREKTYEMPDGNVFNIDDERFRCAEVLFQPSCTGKEASGIRDKSLQNIMKFDDDARKDPSAGVMLLDGTAMIQGIGEHTVKDRNAVQGRIFVSGTVSVAVSLGAKLAQAEGSVELFTDLTPLHSCTFVSLALRLVVCT